MDRTASPIDGIHCTELLALVVSAEQMNRMVYQLDNVKIIISIYFLLLEACYSSFKDNQHLTEFSWTILNVLC